MKYVLMGIKWILFYTCVYLLSQVQIGFLYFNIFTWQFWVAILIANIMFATRIIYIR